MEKKAGECAFLIGFILAVVFSFLPDAWEGTATLILVILGLVVGFLNVTEKETTAFLIASVALLATGTAANTLRVINVLGIGDFLADAVGKIAVFIAPAAILVAVKAVWALAKD
jgi:hypothetical protein